MTFKDWIKNYENENSAVGDLARDVGADTDFPTANDKASILDYFESKSVFDGVISAFNRAWSLYSDFRNKE